VNPDVDPKTHPYISTGLDQNKFGVDVKSALEGYKYAHRLPNIAVKGIDCHIGSQITEATPFKDALKGLFSLVDTLQHIGIHIQYLDVGGGLGIVYDNESPPLPDEYAKAVTDILKGSQLRLILEPGRVIVGNAGILVTQVLYRKKGNDKEFVIVDAAMNDLIRPALYDAYHAIWPVNKDWDRVITADIVGPICETGDFLAVDRQVPDVRQNDLLAVMSAGAYGFAMSSNYCSRLKVAEVMVKESDFHVIRDREEYPDLIRSESLPSFLKG
jgi:diaminopimelate decarboxylase